jgi:hypothetical protein
MVAPKQPEHTPPECRPAPDIQAELPGFGVVRLSLGTIDPKELERKRAVWRGDIACTGPSRVKLPAVLHFTDPDSQPRAYINPAKFRREVIFERALLALSDPAGEAEAVAPLTPVQARQIVLNAKAAPAPVRPDRQQRDDTDLLVRLGGDPTRSSGRVACPAHRGRGRNLAWRWGDRGRLLLKCWSHGCSFDEILKAVA